MSCGTAFYKADMVVLGGDVTGKAMVPIIAGPGYWETRIRGELIRVETVAGAVARFGCGNPG